PGDGQAALVVDEAHLPAALETARARSRSGAVLVEEYLDGPEVTVTAFSVDGELIPLAVTDKLVADPEAAFGVALAHVWPSLHAEAAGEVGGRAVEAAGIGNGPSATRLRVSRGGPEVIDVAARLGEGHDAELVHAATGVDLNALALAAGLGEPLRA